jgi:hypothetical protein
VIRYFVTRECVLLLHTHTHTCVQMLRAELNTLHWAQGVGPVIEARLVFHWEALFVDRQQLAPRKHGQTPGGHTQLATVMKRMRVGARKHARACVPVAHSTERVLARCASRPSQSPHTVRPFH